MVFLLIFYLLLNLGVIDNKILLSRLPKSVETKLLNNGGYEWRVSKKILIALRKTDRLFLCDISGKQVVTNKEYLEQMKAIKTKLTGK